MSAHYFYFMENKKENRGGHRPNAGRKKKAYRTESVSFRVPAEIVPEVKKLVSERIAEYNKNLVSSQNPESDYPD